MTFDPSQHPRADDGQFTEKVGTSPEVALATPLGRRALDKDAARVYGLSRRDVQRIEGFLDDHSVSIDGQDTGKREDVWAQVPVYALTLTVDGETVDGGSAATISLDDYAADLVRSARLANAGDTRYSDRDEVARRVFGAQYADIVR